MINKQSVDPKGGMARRVQADLLQRSGRASEGLRGAPSMESQVMQRYSMSHYSTWVPRRIIGNYCYSQDAETTGGRRLHPVNFASVPARSRMDVQNRQR